MPIELTHQNVRDFAKEIREIVGRETITHTEVIGALAKVLGRRPDAMMHELKSHGQKTSHAVAPEIGLEERAIDRREVGDWLKRGGFSEKAPENEFEQRNVNRSEVVAWLKRRGFEEINSDEFEIDYGPNRIMMRVLSNRVEIFRVWNAPDGSLSTADMMFDNEISALRLDQFDMLHGSALFARFYSDYKEGGVKPAWFSEELLAYLEQSRKK